jgi:hypothetical protein
VLNGGKASLIFLFEKSFKNFSLSSKKLLKRGFYEDFSSSFDAFCV